MTRAFQIAHHCKDMRGSLAEDSDRNDNQRVLRYLAKVTINPALTNGMADTIGSIAPGKVADLVQWPIQSFAAKPRLVVKGGLINWAPMGDPNASLPTPQPVYYRPMFGAYGQALQTTGVTFMSQAGDRRGRPGAARAARGRSGRCATAARSASSTWCATTPCPTSWSIPRRSR